EDPKAVLFRLPYREPADCKTREIQAHERFQRCQSQGAMHASLHYAEQAAGSVISIVMSVAPGSPAHGPLHGFPRLCLSCRVRGAIVQGHGDVRPQLQLYVHRIFWVQAYVAAVYWRAKPHALFRDLSEAFEAKYLETAGVREDGVVPVHKAVEA